MQSIQFIVNKHALMKLACQAKQKQMSKPWITKGILKSIKSSRRCIDHTFLAMTMEK